MSTKFTTSCGLIIIALVYSCASQAAHILPRGSTLSAPHTLQDLWKPGDACPSFEAILDVRKCMSISGDTLLQLPGCDFRTAEEFIKFYDQKHEKKLKNAMFEVFGDFNCLQKIADECVPRDGDGPFMNNVYFIVIDMMTTTQSTITILSKHSKWKGDTSLSKTILDTIKYNPRVTEVEGYRKVPSKNPTQIGRVVAWEPMSIPSVKEKAQQVYSQLAPMVECEKKARV